MKLPIPDDEKFLPCHIVEATCGVKKSFIYKAMVEGTFPRQLKVGRRALWRKSEIEQWLLRQIHLNEGRQGE